MLSEQPFLTGIIWGDVADQHFSPTIAHHIIAQLSIFGVSPPTEWVNSRCQGYGPSTHSNCNGGKEEIGQIFWYSYNNNDKRHD